MENYHNGRRLAITAGVASTTGALAILLADPIITGNWRLDHGLLPVVVFITIAAGHLAKVSRKFGSTIGFAALFIMGTVLTIYSSVGSQKAASGDKAMQIEAHNEAVTAKTADIAKARQRFDEANKEAAKEMTGQKCGQRCANWKQRGVEVQALIRQLEVELAGLGSVKTARPKAEAFAEALAIFGFDRGKVAHIATILEPFAYSLLLELTAIIAFGYAFGHVVKYVPTAAETAQTSFDARVVADNDPVDPSPKGKRGRKRDANVVDFVTQFRAANGRNPNIPEMRMAFPDLDKSTLWRNARAA